MILKELAKCPKCGMVNCTCNHQHKENEICGICHHYPCVCNTEQEEVQYKGKNVVVGKHKDETDTRFDPDELSMGVQDEMEHTGDERTAKNVAKDHLIQNPKYYSTTRKMNMKGGQPPSFKHWLNNGK